MPEGLGPPAARRRDGLPPPSPPLRSPRPPHTAPAVAIVATASGGCCRRFSLSPPQPPRAASRGRALRFCAEDLDSLGAVAREVAPAACPDPGRSDFSPGTGSGLAVPAAAPGRL